MAHVKTHCPSCDNPMEYDSEDFDAYCEKCGDVFDVDTDGDLTDAEEDDEDED